MPLCSAHNRSGLPCAKQALSNGSGVCRNHGGASLRGRLSGRYKHGRYTKEKMALDQIARQYLKELEYLAFKCGLISKVK